MSANDKMEELSDIVGETDRDEENLTGHLYDGIQEYDNPAPGWWHAIFAMSVLFAPVYLLWVHSPVVDRTQLAQYQQAFSDNLKLQFGEIGNLEPDRATILKYMDDDKWLTVGSTTFATHCVSCHGREGEGVQGPNMTDDRYLNVKTVEDIAKVVRDGANNGAMPAWGNRLHPNEVVLVSSYIASLRGKQRPGRQPEGNEIPPWLAAEEEQP
jgi:cytochrome c oxidase cbb3-type subunit 3